MSAPPPVIRIRSDLNDYVAEQALLRGVSPSDFVNGALDAFRFLKPEVRIGLAEQTSLQLLANKGRWIALVVVPPGQGAQWAAGVIEEVGATSLRLSIPQGFATRHYEMSRAWVESYHLLLDQPRSDLRGLVERMRPWGVGIHHLTEAFLAGA